MFTQLVITITNDEREALRRFAERNLRGMKEQVRYAIREMLIAAGELPKDVELGDAQRGPVKGGGLASPN